MTFPGTERRIAKTGGPLNLGNLFPETVTEFPPSVQRAQNEMELITTEQDL